MPQGRPSLLGRARMVSSTHYLASAAGEQVFARGGNAVDAGVAAGIALNVVERNSCDFGGVAPIMVYRPGMGVPEVIDGLGQWPSGLSLERYVEQFRGQMPVGIPRAITPGAPGAWLTALARHGRLTLEAVLQPAIELAEGFPVHERLHRAIRDQDEQLRAWPTSEAVFLPEGRPPEVGAILVQRDLADMLRGLIRVEHEHRSQGRVAAITAAVEAFYRGKIAKEVVGFVQAEGGALSREDMAEHRISIESPAHTTYRGVDVYACGGWSQGPLVPMVLNLLEGFDVPAMGADTVTFHHRFTEAVKLACADREGFFGDPRMVDVPLDGLLSKEYAAERRQAIGDQHAHPRLPLPGDPWRWEGRSGPAGYVPAPAPGDDGRDTAYVCAVDAEGNAFSATPSDSALESPLVPGLGIIVSTRGAQFWLDPAHPSAIAPGKRPRLTPNPAILMRGDSVMMAVGCPGADAQTQAMVRVICNVVDFGMNVQAAIEASRVVSMSFPDSFYPHAYEPGKLLVEGSVEPSVVDALAERGHGVVPMEEFSPVLAAVCAVRVHDNGVLEGGADPRRDSYAIGW